MNDRFPIDVIAFGAEGVSIEASESQGPFVRREPARLFRSSWKHQKCENCNENTGKALNEEEESPLSDRAVDVRHAKADQTAESACESAASDIEAYSFGEFILAVKVRKVKWNCLAKACLADSDEQATNVKGGWRVCCCLAGSGNRPDESSKSDTPGRVDSLCEKCSRNVEDWGDRLSERCAAAFAPNHTY